MDEKFDTNKDKKNNRMLLINRDYCHVHPILNKSSDNVSSF